MFVCLIFIRGNLKRSYITGYIRYKGYVSNLIKHIMEEFIKNIEDDDDKMPEEEVSDDEEEENEDEEDN